MLVLSRKHDQQIRIGDNITISILKIKGNTVRVGIEAPRHVRVLRGELPVFEAMETPIAEEPGGGEAAAETSDEETTVSELEWVVMKRLATRKKPCLPVRSCLAKTLGAAKSPACDAVDSGHKLHVG